MHSLLLEARKDIIFPKDPSKFSFNCQNHIGKWKQLIKEQPENRKDILNTAADICLDLKSFLVNWVLKKSVAQSAIDKEVEAIKTFIAKYNETAILEYIEKETEEIANSSIKEMCEKELRSELHTIWSHDYCSGLNHSLRRGARFVTSNPAKINSYRKEYPDIWAGFVKEIKETHPGISFEKFVSYLDVKVDALRAKDLYPIYEVSNGKYGYVFIQTNPKNTKDSDKMIDEILFWNEEFKKELNVEQPNVIYKIPATKAAVKTVKEILKKGLKVCLTLNFSYSQHDIFSDLLEQGTQQGFVVLMSGFLDDAVDKELASLGIEDSKLYSRHAGEAVIRKSYANLIAKSCKKTAILGAAIRGPWTINNCLTADAENPIYFTTVTEKILEFDSEKRDLKPIINEKVPDDIMATLTKSSIFNQAYDRELLTIDNIDEYIPLNTVLNNFIKAYQETEDSLK